MLMVEMCGLRINVEEQYRMFNIRENFYRAAELIVASQHGKGTIICIMRFISLTC